MFKKIKLTKEITFIISMLVLIMVREYFISIKAGLHVDESLSIILSTYKSIGFDSFGSGFINMSGEDIRNSMYLAHGGFWSAIQDIGRLWVNNRDLPHSNLYYSFLRLWMAPLSESGISNIIGWLAQLNIIFMCISFYFTVRLVDKLTNNINASILCAFIAYTSYFAISNTAFLRPYQFQEMIFVIYAYYTYIIFDSVNIKYCDLARYAVITGVTFLTGYFSLFLIIPMSLILLFNYKSICGDSAIKKLSFYVVSSLVFAFAVYPRYFNINYRTTEAAGKVFSFKENILSSLKVFWDLSSSYPVFAIIAIIGISFSIYCVLKGSSKERFRLWLILAISIFILSAMYFAPYKLARYAYPSLPFYAIIFSSFFLFIDKFSGKAAFVALLSLSCWSVYSNSDGVKVENLFLVKSFDCQNIHNDHTLIIVKDSFKFNTLASCIDGERRYTAIPLKSFENGFDTSKFIYILSDSPVNLVGYDIDYKNIPNISSYFTVYKK